MREKILLVGRRRSGRSSMIRALLREVEAPVFGYETVTMGTRTDGYHEIYLYPYGHARHEKREENHVGDCNTRERVIYKQVFDTLGTSCLTRKEAGILVMDEIGFMESDAAVFCRTILDCLEGPLPVLAAVRTGIETPFLHQVTEHPNVRCIEMAPTRFDEIYRELRPIVQTGNLYRLLSPFSREGLASLMYVDDARSHAVLFIYKVDNYCDQPIPRIRLAGLDPDRTYTLSERNVKNGQKSCSLNGKQFTGRFLMSVGIEVPLRDDYASRVFELK